MTRWISLGSLLLFLLATACSSQHNVVRLKGEQLSLSTEHYLSLDGDKVLELDRGERSLLFAFSRSSQKNAAGTIAVTVRTYDTDPPFKGKLWLQIDSYRREIPTGDIVTEIISESVTVLDSGQRQLDNPNLANSAQAQTGYITFGKPTAAGAATRNWRSYRFRIDGEEDLLRTLSATKKISVFLELGKKTAEAEVAGKQLSGWRKYFSGGYDEKGDP